MAYSVPAADVRGLFSSGTFFSSPLAALNHFKSAQTSFSSALEWQDLVINSLVSRIFENNKFSDEIKNFGNSKKVPYFGQKWQKRPNMGIFAIFDQNRVLFLSYQKILFRPKIYYFRRFLKRD